MPTDTVSTDSRLTRTESPFCGAPNRLFRIPQPQGKRMGRFRALAYAALGLTLFLLLSHRAFGQGNDPLAKVPKLLQVLDRDGFDAKEGTFRILDPIKYACEEKIIPTTYYNNVQPYMSVNLPTDWESTAPEMRRALPINYFLRQDEAVVIVGTTPPPMAYFSYQTFLFGRYNPEKTSTYPKTLGGYFAPYEVLFAYLGDQVSSLTLASTGSNPYNRPMVYISAGNRQTQERVRAALLAAGYPAAIINTETLPASMVRFGYDKGDQFLFLMRMAIAVGGSDVINEFEKTIEAGQVMRVFRVRPKVEFPLDPLPAPVLRPRSTGHTEIDMYPTMEKLRQAIIDSNSKLGYAAQELDSTGGIPEGYPTIEQELAWNGPTQEGTLGYGRDASYVGTEWFNLPEGGFAIVYGLDHSATQKATYSSASIYLDQIITAGIQTVDSGTFAKLPGTATAYLPSEPDASKFYVWKVARNCNGDPHCMEAKPPSVCTGLMSAEPLVRVFFRAYAEPATQVGPPESELLYDRVIVFSPK